MTPGQLLDALVAAAAGEVNVCVRTIPDFLVVTVYRDDGEEDTWTAAFPAEADADAEQMALTCILMARLEWMQDGAPN